MTDPAPIEPDNILEFKPRKEHESPVVRKRAKWDAHKHGRLEIDFDNRVIICQICSESIGPWAALAAIEASFCEITYKYKAVQEWEKKRHEESVKRHEKWKKRTGAVPLGGGTML